MGAVQIIERKVTTDGKDLIVNVLRMGDQEGMLSTEVSKALGVDPATIRQIIIRHGLRNVALDYVQRKTLITSHVMNRHAVRTKFIPKETVKALVKIVHTPEAWAAYNQLWEGLENAAHVVQELKQEAQYIGLEQLIQTVLRREMEPLLTAITERPHYPSLSEPITPKVQYITARQKSLLFDEVVKLPKKEDLRMLFWVKVNAAGDSKHVDTIPKENFEAAMKEAKAYVEKNRFNKFTLFQGGRR